MRLKIAALKILQMKSYIKAIVFRIKWDKLSEQTATDAFISDLQLRNFRSGITITEMLPITEKNADLTSD